MTLVNVFDNTSLAGLFGLAALGKALEYGFVRKGRFKNGERVLGRVKTPAIDRETGNAPSTISTLGTQKTKPSKALVPPVSLERSVSRIIKSPSGVAIAYSNSNGIIPNGTPRKFVKSPSGVMIAYKDDHDVPSRSSSPIPPTEHQGYETTLPATSNSFLRGLSDAIEVLYSVRGIGWDFGKGMYVPPETRPLDRAGFLRATFFSFLGGFLTLDFLESCFKIIPHFSTPKGGSIFFITAPPSFLVYNDTFLTPFIKEHPHLSTLITRYTVSTLITFFTGLAIIAGFHMCYCLLTLLGVGVLGHNPESWPPLFDSPWRTTSLADFWGKQWHQTLRQTFFTFVGYPLQFIVETLTWPFGKKVSESAGRVGLVLGTFIASGLFHSLAIFAMGTGGVDHKATLYFTFQGFMLFVERLFKIITGKRVGGPLGRIWTYCIVIFPIEPVGKCHGFISF
ncbi:hypothetical protein CPB86DRAFT_790680 [Serendipita vermifera]|nr:hypothetical protein CPB86DRAFT_790680 [Serendipita vermifera]